MTPPAAENKPVSVGPELLAQQRQRHGQALLLTRRGRTVSASFEKALHGLLEQAESRVEGPIVLTSLSNTEVDLNPFAGLSPGAQAPGPDQLENLVRLLGPGRLHAWNRWPAHLALLSPSAAELLAREDTTAENALARLKAGGGRLLVADALFSLDRDAPLFAATGLEPHEERRPVPWGQLRERLDEWLRHPLDAATSATIEDYCNGEQVTVHITHSWGGGVARWVESFIDADGVGVNLQLRSEGPQSGQGCGQRCSLYLGNRLETPVASWWLEPAIQATEDGHPAYREMFRELLGRHGAGRVMVSSLVGHSLDALASGLPTTQVLHDFYPAWPLLGVHPGSYLKDGADGALDRALAEHELLPEFRGRDAAGWQALGLRWLQMLRSQEVRLAAPSRSVSHLLAELDPDWADAGIRVIPHGLPALPGNAEVSPREREDGRLRLVIPGRIQAGKGRDLLLRALPELTRYAQVYLLGAGKDGEAFFGRAGVNVIMQYRRDELRQTMAAIGPHVAGLLSVVPETFSYTLSEMLQMKVPVIATRVGSLAERIEDGCNGWLIEPDPAALVERVKALSRDAGAIAAVRERLAGLDLPGTEVMAAQYGKLCPPLRRSRDLGRPVDVQATQAAAFADRVCELSRQLRELEAESHRLAREVDERTQWAQDRERARKDERERRIQWVSALENQLEERFSELQAARDAFAHEQQEHEQSRVSLANLNAAHQRLQGEHDWVLASRSWRITRPLRFSARVLANLKRAGAWNPLRWPLLLSQSYRVVKTRGLRGALMRAQLEQAPVAAPEKVDADTAGEIGSPEAPEAMPFPQQPQVSIVIPVYNKWLYTAACLRSLLETRCAASFEVIVVDDHSSDESQQRLQQVEGLVYLRNEENLGFIGSCNRGAEAARGRFIVMLNNDTQVLDGWLDALLDTFDPYPDTGLAGARLIYPDGSLQEAGGIIFRDGSGWNYGKHAPADSPEYQYVREVDYVSGACIILRTDLFREFGGFDSHYAPAYYEDTDLAFRVRAQGLKVRVQPAATIIHHEGITSGTDIGSGAKRYQAVNRDKFLQRWEEELAHYPAPIVNPEDRAEIRRARDHRLKGRVLVIDAYTPEPDQDSGSVRLTYLMKCLRDIGYGVTFMPDNQAFAGRYTRDLQQAGIEAVYTPWVSSLQRFFQERGAEFDFVMVSRHYVASRYVGLVRRHCPQARFIFDTVDLHYLREERLAELENSLPLKRAAAQTRRSELGVIEASDATLVVSPVEKTVLETAAPNARVHVISNVHEVVGSQKPWGQRKDLFFVGGYQHPPNIDAAHWFVNSIWPLIHAELPGVEFHLIGSKAPEEIRALHGNGVQFQGFVESIEPWLDNCRLAVAPLRYGAGVKGKVNMSMSRGQPVVATPMAVEGMFAREGQDILVADSAEDFAAEVVRIYRDEDLWNRVSASGLENVSRYFSVETARLGLQELLNSL